MRTIKTAITTWIMLRRNCCLVFLKRTTCITTCCNSLWLSLKRLASVTTWSWLVLSVKGQRLHRRNLRSIVLLFSWKKTKCWVIGLMRNILHGMMTLNSCASSTPTLQPARFFRSTWLQRKTTMRLTVRLGVSSTRIL